MQTFREADVGLIIPVYLLERELLTQAVQSAFGLIPWWFACFLPINPFSHRQLAARSLNCTDVQLVKLAMCANMFNIFKSLRTFSPCRSITFLLDVGIELTANQCQSVCPLWAQEAHRAVPNEALYGDLRICSLINCAPAVELLNKL